jgi:hypothetical protein
MDTLEPLGARAGGAACIGVRRPKDRLPSRTASFAQNPPMSSGAQLAGALAMQALMQ